MQIIEREKVTSIGGVPTIMWRILESPNLDKYDLSSVKRACYGGAPAAPELVERIEQVFPHLRKTLTTAYGLTETASVATAHGGDDYFAHPGSVGRAAPTVELRIVDEQGDDAPAGERGEIWLKGPTVMAHGYWRRPDANEAAFTDGWFHTGDIGYVDPDGFLYLVDRAKDMIIRAGENVYCVEIENVLFDHPDVVDAAVVGVPHKTLGEEVKAVVQVRDGSTVDGRRHPRVLPRAPRRLQGARVRRDPFGRAAAAQSRRQGVEEPAARRRFGVRSRRRPSALVLLEFHHRTGVTPRSSRTFSRARTRSAAWRWKSLRTRWLWWPTIIAEAMMMVQVLLGVLLVERARTTSRPASTCSTASSRSSPSGSCTRTSTSGAPGVDGARLRLGRSLHHGPGNPSRPPSRLTHPGGCPRSAGASLMQKILHQRRTVMRRVATSIFWRDTRIESLQPLSSSSSVTTTNFQPWSSSLRRRHASLMYLSRLPWNL